MADEERLRAMRDVMVRMTEQIGVRPIMDIVTEPPGLVTLLIQWSRELEEIANQIEDDWHEAKEEYPE